MDPVTHALLGATAARTVLGRRLGNAALAPGVIGAILPDLDAFIRSTADPLLYAEFHRHFTHALAFAPAGGLLASLPWILNPLRSPRDRLYYFAAATVGCGTHGLLDASTTYGTRLFWPFSQARVGWSFISIIDPLFTLFLLIGILATLWRKSAGPARMALIVSLLYLGVGASQRSRVDATQTVLAAARGHPSPTRRVAVPTFGNHLVWRSVYLAGDSLYFDRLRVPWRGPVGWSPGSRVALFTATGLPSSARSTPRLMRDFERFAHFAGGWVALDPRDPTLIGDVRYSRSDEHFDPVWGIRLTADPGGGHTEWVDRSRDRNLSLSALWSEISGRSGSFEQLPQIPGD